MDALTKLGEKADREWKHLAAARRLSASTRDRLGALLRDEAPSDTSIVVFGSLARDEYTPGSDVDWTLLVDGQADEGHYGRARAIGRILDEGKFNKPGPTGVFGNMAFSHPILHQIGGQDDTNRNTTQRILLLLESAVVGRNEAHERVLRLVLTRYVEDDRGLLYGSKSQIIPRFLLNDIVRYWRTMAVDFVLKQRERSEGWALRNAKLRMSRKLIFVSGMLTCFAFELFGGDRSWASERKVPELVRFLRERLERTPLENLAEALLRPSIKPETVQMILDAYDAFVGILADDEKRLHLKNLSFDALGSDPLFRGDISKLSGAFQDGLNRLFFEEDPAIGALVKLYGVF
jgi:hypothetical protein